MNLYDRKIPYYKSFKLVDSDGDGIKDTITYRPISDFYYIQFGLEQDIKNIGHYIQASAPKLEILDLTSVWNEGHIAGHGSGPKSKSSPPEQTTTPNNEIIDYKYKIFQPTTFCNDPQANNYDQTLIGVDGYIPCADNSCCTYNSTKSYSKSSSDEYEDLNCLAFYTDWGPWNDNLLLNDTQQIYVKKIECTLTLRLINQLGIENTFVKGGWYGASVKIEIDEGNGFTTLQPGSPLIQNLNNGIEYDQNKGSYTLNDKVRIWKSKSTLNTTKYYTTKPYRDIVIKPTFGTKIKITYINSNQNIPEYEKYAKYLRLQLIKGSSSTPTPAPPTLTNVLSGFTWSQNITELSNFLGTPYDRQSDGETFHYISDESLETKNKVWDNYLFGYKIATPIVPWGPANSKINVGSFYGNPNVKVLNDFGNTTDLTIINGFSNSSLNYFSNPDEIIKDFVFECSVKENYVSYFDRNGDGFIEFNQLYPEITYDEISSVDTGLFSKTRYDSPYIFLKPGTKDGTEPLLDNPLTKASKLQSDVPVGPSSSGGWKNYAYVTTAAIKSLNNNFAYSFKNTSPTCQLGGINNLNNIDISLVDGSNNNIFLQQPNYSVVENATFGTGTTVPHIWNYGFTNSKGGCCAKRYNTSLDISKDGPYYNSKCFNCHAQMTARSAQPVLDKGVKIAMQTTDSDVYYGPFYDPQNPTYNGYGLAFSKANKFCRDVKNKNGVLVNNSEIGVKTDALYLGGILHGGAVQYKPNTNFSDNYGVKKSIQLGFDEVLGPESSSTCLSGTKLPLKCRRVVNDPNCPKNNCMKCIFCFKCSSEEKQPGVFTGNNSDPNGPTDGINYLG